MHIAVQSMGSDIDVGSLLGGVHGYSEFLTGTELNRELKRLASSGKIKLASIGKSKGGRQIYCAVLGNGKKNALVFGFPHSNEAVGSLTCLELIKAIPKSKAMQQFRWYIIPCADPDGAALNEGWFKGKFTLRKYVHNFYRGKLSAQMDWSFPVDYKGRRFSGSPPNVKALVGLIMKVKPELVFPIHNSGMGGAYFFLTRRMPSGYYKEVSELCRSFSVPLDMGEPEEEFMVTLRKPFYMVPSFSDYSGYFKDEITSKKSLPIGTTSVDFAKSYNRKLFGIVAEVPYIIDDRVQDNSPTTMHRRDELSERIGERQELADTLRHALECDGVNKRSPFYGTLEWLLGATKNRIEMEKKALKEGKYGKRATVAEKFSSEVIERFYEAVALGEVRRLLLESRSCAEEHDTLRSVDREIDFFINKIENEGEPKALPIRDLVQVQLGFLLISIKHLG